MESRPTRRLTLVAQQVAGQPDDPPPGIVRPHVVDTVLTVGPLLVEKPGPRQPRQFLSDSRGGRKLARGLRLVEARLVTAQDPERDGQATATTEEVGADTLSIHVGESL